MLNEVSKSLLIEGFNSNDISQLNSVLRLLSSRSELAEDKAEIFGLISDYYRQRKGQDNKPTLKTIMSAGPELFHIWVEEFPEMTNYLHFHRWAIETCLDSKININVGLIERYLDRISRPDPLNDIEDIKRLILIFNSEVSIEIKDKALRTLFLLKKGALICYADFFNPILTNDHVVLLKDKISEEFTQRLVRFDFTYCKQYLSVLPDRRHDVVRVLTDLILTKKSEYDYSRLPSLLKQYVGYEIVSDTLHQIFESGNSSYYVVDIVSKIIFHDRRLFLNTEIFDKAFELVISSKCAPEANNSAFKLEIFLYGALRRIGNIASSTEIPNFSDGEKKVINDIFSKYFKHCKIDFMLLDDIFIHETVVSSLSVNNGRIIAQKILLKFINTSIEKKLKETISENKKDSDRIAMATPMPK